MNELIIIKQLPIIEETLKNLSEEIDLKVKNANELVVNDETVKQVKKVRTELGEDFKILEQKRKDVKTQVLAPYEAFETIYKQYVSDKFKTADLSLKTKIDKVESDLKDKKLNETVAYYDEYASSLNLDWITTKEYFEKLNIKVGLSDNLTNLKKQAKTFIDKIVSELELIETQEHKTEILVEYKQNLNVSSAIMNVTNRFKAIEQEKARQEELEKIKQEELQKETQKKIEELSKPSDEKMYIHVPRPVFAPIVEEPKQEKTKQAEEQLTVNFKVTSTIENLKKLKEFLNNGGYKYE